MWSLRWAAGTHRDVTELKRSEELRKLALSDELTGLNNRPLGVGSYRLVGIPTDAARNRPEWTDGIIEALAWIGIGADDPHFREPSKPVGRFVAKDEAERFMAHGQIWEDRGEKGWRRVVGLFRKVGARNVKFVWTVAKERCSGGCNPFADHYPGDHLNYVYSRLVVAARAAQAPGSRDPRRSGRPACAAGRSAPAPVQSVCTPRGTARQGPGTPQSRRCNGGSPAVLSR